MTVTIPEEEVPPEETLPLSDDLDLGELWRTFRSGRVSGPPGRVSAVSQAEFIVYLRKLVSDPEAIDEVEFCGNCGLPAWDDDMSNASHGDMRICEDCWDDWTSCDGCDERYPAHELTETLGGSYICGACRHDGYTYCDDCSGYYPDECSGDHDHSSNCCTSPQLEFTIRNNGCEPLANDVRITVTLPAGTISAEGISEISRCLARQRLYNLAADLDQIGTLWQAKAGNYPKRLSRHAYENHQVKLTPEVISQVGCIARDHSKQASVQIEVTRNLNLPPGDFANEGSCWWSSYSESRCALKTNGGFALRSFKDGDVTGRAWVLPLRLDLFGGLTPTFDTRTPDAFVVFNGYGDLDSYAAPRILAHLAGWTYRKIGFECSPMYINAGGYLVAPEEIAGKYTDKGIDLRVRQHAKLFDTERAREEETERTDHE